MGGRVGISGIPASWVAGLERSEELTALAEEAVPGRGTGGGVLPERVEECRRNTQHVGGYGVDVVEARAEVAKPRGDGGEVGEVEPILADLDVERRRLHRLIAAAALHHERLEVQRARLVAVVREGGGEVAAAAPQFAQVVRPFGREKSELREALGRRLALARLLDVGVHVSRIGQRNVRLEEPAELGGGLLKVGLWIGCGEGSGGREQSHACCHSGRTDHLGVHHPGLRKHRLRD